MATAPSTWRSRLSFCVRMGAHDGAMSEACLAVSVLFKTHDGAKYVVIPDVFLPGRFGTHDGAMYVRSSCWAFLQSMWTLSKRFSLVFSFDFSVFSF